MFDGPTTSGNPDIRGRLALAGLLMLAYLTRAAGHEQPIVENYVGRQVPTAMVARNLERGSGFFRPRIDVAPFPNLFLVEPPIFAALAVGLRRVSGLPLDDAGRLVSALGIVLGGWGLYGLTVRREGNIAALGAVAAFVTFPVTIRYGRSFQPDALMLGCVIAGVRYWEEFEETRGISRLVAAWILLAMGLALKVISVWVLVPLVLVVIRERRPWKLVLAAATLLPAALWYAGAAWLIATGEGSRASADNGSIWLRVLVPATILRGETYWHVFRFLGVRAFTPLGPVLALTGLIAFKKDGDGLWRTWSVSALTMLAFLAAKLHHEYYWLAIAPVMAVGVSRALVGLCGQGARGRLIAGAAAVALVGLSAVLSVSTWKTPPEWAGLEDAGREVRRLVAEEELVIAPEALLYEADRRGCRLELTASSARRAAGEWGENLGGSGASVLVEFYRRHGASYFADVYGKQEPGDRLALHDEVRRRYNVLVDRPGVLIARLIEPREDELDGNGPGQHAAAPDRRDDP